MFHRKGKHPIRRNLIRILLLAVTAMLAGWLAALAGWTWGSSVPPGAESVEVLRKRYPAVQRANLLPMTPFGVELVNGVDAYVTAKVLDSMLPTEFTNVLYSLMTTGRVSSRFPESWADALQHGKITMRLAAWQVRIEEIVFQKASEAEDPRLLATGRKIWIIADVTPFAALPSFEPGTRIVAGLHVVQNAAREIAYTAFNDEASEIAYTFPLTGAFYRMRDDRVLTAVQESDISLCDGIPYKKLRDRLLSARTGQTNHGGKYDFSDEKQLANALVGGGGIIAPKALASLQALADRTGLRESGWFRPGFLPEEAQIRSIRIGCLPDMATVEWNTSDSSLPDEWFGTLSWNLDESDSEARLAGWILLDDMTESETPGVYIGRENTVDYATGFSAAWIQYGHCFYTRFPSDFDRAEAPAYCDVEPAVLP